MPTLVRPAADLACRQRAGTVTLDSWPSLKLTVGPWKWAGPQKESSLPTTTFSGAILVSGSVGFLCRFFWVSFWKNILELEWIPVTFFLFCRCFSFFVGLFQVPLLVFPNVCEGIELKPTGCAGPWWYLDFGYRNTDTGTWTKRMTSGCEKFS